MIDQELINTANRFYVSLTSVRRHTLDSGAVGIIDLKCWVQNSENHLGEKKETFHQMIQLLVVLL